MQISYKIHISGRVQKVGFRYYAKKTAYDLDIKGFIKNLPDGRVYAEISGYQKDVEAFIMWCKQGPAMAEVESVELEPLSRVDFSSFEIL